jgi:transmembrane sensor
MRVAAGLLLLIASTTAVGDFTGWLGNVYTTGLGEQRRITLADGTHVELNTDTVLRERMTTGLRTVILERGEAYFEVRHDQSRPFVVQLGQHSVTDIGTKFFVRRDAARLSVGVIEGRIEFETSGDTYRAKPLLLGAGSMVVATPRRIVLSTPSAEAISSELAWRSGMLVFNHTTLAEAVAEFNRYNREKLVIADPRASRLLIGGSFRTNDVKVFARVAQDLLGVHVKDKPGEQVISR